MVEKDLLTGRRPAADPVPGLRRRPAARWLRAAALLACVSLVAACGPERAVAVRTEPPRDVPAEREDGGREVPDEPPAADAAGTEMADPGAGTARRQASEHLAGEGVRALEAGDVAGAARRLEEAIRVDGSNGLAYYHLARVRIQDGRNEEARGLLDRAIELLRPYPELRQDAERLRSGLSGSD